MNENKKAEQFQKGFCQIYLILKKDNELKTNQTINLKSSESH